MSRTLRGTTSPITRRLREREDKFRASQIKQVKKEYPKAEGAKTVKGEVGKEASDTKTTSGKKKSNAKKASVKVGD